VGGVHSVTSNVLFFLNFEEMKLHPMPAQILGIMSPWYQVLLPNCIKSSESPIKDYGQYFLSFHPYIP
jgi:hypothetical protein